jgi:recombination protein RecA
VQFLRENAAVREEIAAAIKEKRTPKVLDADALAATAAEQEAEAAAELAALGEEVPAAPKKKRGKASE